MSGIINYLYSFFSSPEKRFYGWKRGDKYKNHKKYLFTINKNLKNIIKIDLRYKCPPVYDQGSLGSCSANAIGFCYHFDELKQQENSPFIPSRLFLYYNERVIEGNVNLDSGAEIHDGIQSINQTGLCHESMWVYDTTKFKDKPTDDCYTDALSHKAIEYRAIPQELDQIKQCLVDGYPIVFGFLVYQSFESSQVAATGIVPMPQPNESVIGGHAVASVGYDDEKNWFIVRNSWGSNWGDNGYFYMPYAYVLNSELADDFWTVSKITVPSSIFRKSKKSRKS